jgi:glyoxylase-like metal-dependent hydrolase (beta-lactamase superfamily II)
MKLSNNIHIIKHNLQNQSAQNCLKPTFVYSMILFGDNITLINTGPVGGENVIFDYIKKQKRSVDEIDTLILTRAKNEFIGAAPALKLAINCTIVAHYEETAKIEKLLGRLRNNMNTTAENLHKVNYLISGNEKFTFGENLDVDFVYTHSQIAGSLSVYFTGQKIYFTENFTLIPFIESSQKNNSIFQNGKIKSVQDIQYIITPFDEPVSGSFIKQVA